MRMLTTDQAERTRARKVRGVILVEIVFDTGSILVSNALFSTTVGGRAYQGAGQLLNLEFPQEDASLSARPGRVVLNGLDPAMLSLALNEDTEGKTLLVDMALRDVDTGAQVGPPIRLARGTTGQLTIRPATPVVSR